MSGAPVNTGTVMGKEAAHAVERTGRVAWKAVAEAALKAAGSRAANVAGWAMKRNLAMNTLTFLHFLPPPPTYTSTSTGTSTKY